MVSTNFRCVRYLARKLFFKNVAEFGTSSRQNRLGSDAFRASAVVNIIKVGVVLLVVVRGPLSNFVFGQNIYEPVFVDCKICSIVKAYNIKDFGWK